MFTIQCAQCRACLVCLAWCRCLLGRATNSTDSDSGSKRLLVDPGSVDRRCRQTREDTFWLLRVWDEWIRHVASMARHIQRSSCLLHRRHRCRQKHSLLNQFCDFKKLNKHYERKRKPFYLSTSSRSFLFRNIFKSVGRGEGFMVVYWFLTFLIVRQWRQEWMTVKITFSRQMK